MLHLGCQPRPARQPCHRSERITLFVGALFTASALLAGGIFAHAQVRSEAMSSLAGTGPGIAVALVPPVCVMGLLLSADQRT